jgi:hypothetical protein
MTAVNDDATHRPRFTVNTMNPQKSPEPRTLCKRCRDSGHMAEPAGFEPAVRYNPDPSLAVMSVRPLRHGSVDYLRAHAKDLEIDATILCGRPSTSRRLHSVR